MRLIFSFRINLNLTCFRARIEVFPGGVSHNYDVDDVIVSTLVSIVSLTISEHLIPRTTTKSLVRNTNDISGPLLYMNTCS